MEVHGCELGVTDKHGQPIHKPWWIYSSNQQFVNEMWEFKCRGEHTHVQCAGCRTTATGFYPPFMAGKLLDAMQYNEHGTAVPAMVCQEQNLNGFRPKEGEYRTHSADLYDYLQAMVARVVGFKEMKSNQSAVDAVAVEMGKLRDNTVWDEKRPKTRDEVIASAENRKIEVHMARIFSTCTQNNFEMPEWMRKYKGRVCLDGMGGLTW